MRGVRLLFPKATVNRNGSRLRFFFFFLNRRKIYCKVFPFCLSRFSSVFLLGPKIGEGKKLIPMLMKRRGGSHY